MWQTLIVVAVMFVIYVIRDSHAVNKARREEWKITPEQAKEAEECLQRTKTDLEIRGLRQLMLSDYRFRAQVTDEDRQDMRLLQAKLDGQLQELIRYLHLPQAIHVRVYTDDPEGQKAAGTFDLSNSAVNVYYQPYYDAGYLNEIIFHECAHYFRHCHHIRVPDKMTEEKCTDITACLMGGRQYVVNANNMGYLRPGQLKLVWDFLDKYRKENGQAAAGQAGGPAQAKPAAKPQPAARTQQSDPNAERENLRRQIEAAQAMVLQARDIMAVKKVPTRTDLTEKDYAWLKQCAEKLSSGRYVALLSQCEKDSQGSTVRLRNAKNQVMDVCADMSRLMWVFR